SHTQLYTLSLHDALPISRRRARGGHPQGRGAERLRSAVGLSLPSALPSGAPGLRRGGAGLTRTGERPPRRLSSLWSLRRSTEPRSEEHTSELQSRSDLVC